MKIKFPKKLVSIVGFFFVGLPYIAGVTAILFFIFGGLRLPVLSYGVIIAAVIVSLTGVVALLLYLERMIKNVNDEIKRLDEATRSNNDRLDDLRNAIYNMKGAKND